MYNEQEELSVLKEDHVHSTDIEDSANTGCMELTPVQDSNSNQFFKYAYICLQARNDNQQKRCQQTASSISWLSRRTDSRRIGHHPGQHFASKAEDTATVFTGRQQYYCLRMRLIKTNILSVPRQRPWGQAPSCSRPVSVVINCIHSRSLIPYSHRDFHSLKLNAINALLSFTRFPTIERIEDFDLLKFKEQGIQLEDSKKAKTKKQQYIASCKMRVLEASDSDNLSFWRTVNESKILYLKLWVMYQTTCSIPSWSFCWDSSKQPMVDC